MADAAQHRTAAWIAAASAMLMIAEHIGGKAVRDALFLSTFGVESLPTMFIIAAVTSIAVVPVFSRILAHWGPERVVMPAFAASAVLIAGSSFLYDVFPRVAAVVVYLHVAAVNAVLISWFWSLVNERFDPRTAKREMRRMVGGATLGGLVGGLVVERASQFLGPSRMLLVLAGMHVLCALATSRLRGTARRDGHAVAPPMSGFGVFRRSSYARNLALMVVVSTACAALLDYVFKVQAVAAYEKGPALLRFFALYYAASGLVTFLLSSLLGHLALSRLGIAGTVGTLPAAVVVGSVAAILSPGLVTATGLRSSEMALHSSLFRSGYELLYTPLPPGEKRSIKTLIDVGFDRLGDAIGGGLLKLLLPIVGAYAVGALLGVAIGLSLFVIVLIYQLHRGYVRALERSLRDRVVQVDMSDVRDSTTLSVLRSIQDLPALATARPGAVAPAAAGIASSSSSAVAPAAKPPDPLLDRIAALRSGESDRVRRALAEGPLVPALVPHVVTLLAWDIATPWAIAALGRIANGCVGQLVDALLNPDEEFAVRRRIPRALELSDSPRAVAGLLDGLADIRFEVRYRCGRALARIHGRNPDLEIDRDRIFAAVIKEAAIERSVWESQRLLDDDETEAAGANQDPFIDELLRDRANRSLAHVFTLLSLAFPRQPLALAFKGLHTSDEHLRGTALEYLEGVLPSEVRAPLWPFLEDRRPPAQRTTRPRQQVLDELLLSNRSIQLNLEERLRKPG